MDILTILGNRTEKMIHLSIFVVIISWSFNYFSKAVVYNNQSNPLAYKLLHDEISHNLENLNELYENMISSEDKENPLVLIKLNKTRVTLGLPPIIEDKKTTNKYIDEIYNIINNTSYSTGFNKDKLLLLFKPTSSPQEILDKCKIKITEVQNKKVNVWGIESPVNLIMNYGGSNYLIANTLAANLLSLISPMVIILWLGSFYLTRNREVRAINETIDYRVIHPHLLNIIYIQNKKPNEDIKNNLIDKKNNVAILSFSLIRSFFIFVIASLMLYPYESGIIPLCLQINKNPIIILLHFLFSIIIITEVIMVIHQEKTSINKCFYE